jgi:pimeloyl-ACP methyl ester carboxylesterase
VFDVHVDQILLTGSGVHLAVHCIGAVFEGELTGTIIEGEWRQAGKGYPIAFRYVHDVPAPPGRPQNPTRPYPYREEAVVYENRGAAIKLAGTLTLPRAGDPFAAVLLLAGSGLHDRDETAFGHKPFLVLADHLTRRSIAVLRADKRGVWQSTGSFQQATIEDFASDALAGISYLQSRDDIDALCIGLVGHSEGGMIAPLLASRCPDIAFVVLMAGPGIRMDELMVMQKGLYARAEGASEEQIAARRKWYKTLYATVQSEQDDTKARQAMYAFYAGMSEGERESLGLSESEREREISENLSPWARHILGYDPKTSLEKVHCPVLAINGEKDLQVTPEENLCAIEEALKAGGNRQYTVKEISGLNHLFQTAETGAESEYRRIAETISPTVLTTISDWISQQIDPNGQVP